MEFNKQELNKLVKNEYENEQVEIPVPDWDRFEKNYFKEVRHKNSLYWILVTALVPAVMWSTAELSKPKQTMLPSIASPEVKLSVENNTADTTIALFQNALSNKSKQHTGEFSEQKIKSNYPKAVNKKNRDESQTNQQIQKHVLNDKKTNLPVLKHFSLDKAHPIPSALAFKPSALESKATYQGGLLKHVIPDIIQPTIPDKSISFPNDGSIGSPVESTKTWTTKTVSVTDTLQQSYIDSVSLGNAVNRDIPRENELVHVVSRPHNQFSYHIELNNQLRPGYLDQPINPELLLFSQYAITDKFSIQSGLGIGVLKYRLMEYNSLSYSYDAGSGIIIVDSVLAQHIATPYFAVPFRAQFKLSHSWQVRMGILLSLPVFSRFNETTYRYEASQNLPNSLDSLDRYSTREVDFKETKLHSQITYDVIYVFERFQFTAGARHYVINGFEKMSLPSDTKNNSGFLVALGMNYRF